MRVGSFGQEVPLILLVTLTKPPLKRFITSHHAHTSTSLRYVLLEPSLMAKHCPPSATIGIATRIPQLSRNAHPLCTHYTKPSFSPAAFRTITTTQVHATQCMCLRWVFPLQSLIKHRTTNASNSGQGPLAPMASWALSTYGAIHPFPHSGSPPPSSPPQSNPPCLTFACLSATACIALKIPAPPGLAPPVPYLFLATTRGNAGISSNIVNRHGYVCVRAVSVHRALLADRAAGVLYLTVL